jgi:hypothetical protein
MAPAATRRTRISAERDAEGLRGTNAVFIHFFKVVLIDSFSIRSDL